MPSLDLEFWFRLSHDQRMYEAYKFGLDPANHAAIDELEKGDSFARRLALQTIHGSRDGALALRLSQDDSRIIRRGAIKALARFGTSDQIEVSFFNGNEVTRRSLFRILAKNKRRDVIDALCLSLRNHGEEWQSLAPYASADFLNEHFEEAFARAGDLEWTRLARHHPKLALTKLSDAVRGLEERDFLLLSFANDVLPEIGPNDADRALSLVRELLEHFALGDIEFSNLVSHRPEEIAQLVLSHPGKISLNFGPFVSRLQPETLRRLLLNRPETLTQPQRWLGKLPLPEREALWTEFHRGWQFSNGSIALELLPLLPRIIRESEARRHLTLPDLAARPEQWLPYAAFLEHDELLGKIGPIITDPDPALRAAAYSALTRNVRFARQHIDDLLTRLQRHGNEQDPVRQSMLYGLAQLPPSIWRDEHLPLLAAVQRQALDARDLSSATASQLEKLIIGILPNFPAWAAQQLAILVKERGRVSHWNLEARLTDAQMTSVGPQLLPVLRAWMERDRFSLLGAMRSLGRRLKVWDEGAALLADAAKHGPNEIAPPALDILARSRPALFAEIVPQLMEADGSWGTQPIIYNHVHRRRQDLLNPVLLGREVPVGRFTTSKNRVVLPLSSGFARWNPRQQATWALTLQELIADSQRDTPSAISAVVRLAALPDIPPTALLESAQLENPVAVIREAALRALGRLDSPWGVPLLIDALDDERARIAIYALRRVLLVMPEERSLEILRATPLIKVTVVKEVIRLLGDLKSEAAFNTILEFAAKDLHRDARVALLRALWDHLENDQVWPLLEAAANSDDSAIARMAARTTSPRLSKTARRRLNALRAQMLAHPDPRVRLEVLSALPSGASDPDKELRSPLFQALQSRLPSESNAAAQAIWNIYSDKDSDLFKSAITLLLPRRQALKTIVEGFANRARFAPLQFQGTGRAMLEALRQDPLLLSLRLKLSFDILPVEEFAELVEHELSAGALHSQARYELVELLQSAYFWGQENGTLSTLISRWSDAPAPELRRLALACLVNQGRATKGWTDDRVEALRAFQRDSSPVVAAAAQWVFPPGQEEIER